MNQEIAKIALKLQVVVIIIILDLPLKEKEKSKNKQPCQKLLDHSLSSKALEHFLQKEQEMVNKI